MIGLKEGKVAGRTMTDYIKKTVCDGLGLQGHEYEIERSRRGGGPRMIVMKFLRYAARQINERGIQWEDCTRCLRTLDQGALRPAQTVLPHEESAVGASGETRWHPRLS